MKWLYVFFLINFMLLSSYPVTAVNPQIDGKVSNGEWDGSELHIIELNTGIEVNLSIMYTPTSVYYLAIIDHSREVNTINIDPNQPHDYFGIEFDNNNDEAIMGTQKSPDDTIIVNYKENTGADMFMHSFKAFYDIDYGGKDDVAGKAGTDGKNLIFEIEKPLSSSDPNGHDFELIPGEQYQIMIAFWDDQLAHSAEAGFNKRIDNNQFLPLVVNANFNTTQDELISLFVILIFGYFSYILIKFGIDGTFQKIKDLMY